MKISRIVFMMILVLAVLVSVPIFTSVADARCSSTYCTRLAVDTVGGGTGALDSVVCDGGECITGDPAIVIDKDVDQSMFYTYDADSALAESDPDVIKPDDVSGNGRWILKSIAGEAVTTTGDLAVTGDMTVTGTATITGNLTGGVNSGATYVVCSSTANSNWKCDYTADGTDDDVQIQAAIDAIEAAQTEGGGLIQLTEGLFTIGDTITISKGNLKLKGVGAGFEGQGGTKLLLANTINKDIILLEGSATQYFVYIEDMNINGNKANNSSNGGGIVNNDGNFNDVIITNVFVNYTREHGIETHDVWGWVLDRVVIEYAEGYGFYAVSGRALKILNSKIIGNVDHSVYLWSVNDPILTGNLLRAEAGKYALYLKDTESSVVNGNNFRSTAGSGEIYLTGGSNYSGITGNTFGGSVASAIEWAASENGSTIVGNNFVADYTTAIKEATTVDTVIENNVGADETVTSGSPALQPWGFTKLDSSGGAITATLPSGYYVGQPKIIVMTEATTSSTVSTTNHETEDPEVCTFDAVDEVWVLEWTNTEWVTIKATCTFL